MHWNKRAGGLQQPFNYNSVHKYKAPKDSKDVIHFLSRYWRVCTENIGMLSALQQQHWELHMWLQSRIQS